MKLKFLFEEQPKPFSFLVRILGLTALFVAAVASVDAQRWEPLANQPVEPASATCSQDGITLYAALVERKRSRVFSLNKQGGNLGWKPRTEWDTIFSVPGMAQK